MIIRPLMKPILLVLASLFMLGCASKSSYNADNQNPSQQVMQQNATQKQKRILVINSHQSIERYQVAESVFVESMSDYATLPVNLENESKPIEYLQDILNKQKFDAIYCIGAKALGSIDYLDPQVPVVYSAVLNWRRFKDRENFYGISSELSPQVQLTLLKYLLPDIKKVSVLYGEENQNLIRDAQAVSENLGIILNPQSVRSTHELSVFAQAALEETDALWLISDSSTLASQQNVAQLFKMTENKKVPVISYNSLFMDFGSIMSVVADLPTTARQAALLTMRLLENERPKELVQYPAGSRIIVDSKLVQKYGLTLNPESLDSIDELR